VPGRFGFALGFATGVPVTILAVAAGATSHPVWALITLTVAVAAVSAVTTLGAALGTAAVCWSLHSGFVLGRRGDLVFTAGSLRAAVVLVLTAGTFVVVASAVRAGLAWRHTRQIGPGQRSIEEPAEWDKVSVPAGRTRRRDGNPDRLAAGQPAHELNTRVGAAPSRRPPR